jgi:hypothetical protein
VLDQQQRPVRQPGQEVEHVRGVGSAERGDLLRGGQAERAGEHRQPAQRRLFARREHVIAPVQRGPQRLVPRRPAFPPAHQQLEHVVEAGQHLGDGHHPQLRRGELDGQRQAVQPAAQLADQFRVVVGDLEAGKHGPGAVEEELHGLGTGQQSLGPRRRRCLGTSV